MKKAAVLLTLTVVFAAACKRKEQAATGSHGFDTAGQTSTATTAAPANAPAQTTSVGIDVGSVMPAYNAMWLDGTPFDLASRKEKVVLLNLWATWCGPCRYEIPELQRMHNEYAAKGFEVIGVSVDESGVDPVKEFVAEQKVTYPIVLDAEGKLADLLQTSVLPTTVLVGRDGKIVWKKYGAIFENDPELKKAIESAL